jgi:hypothetical protein
MRSLLLGSAVIVLTLADLAPADAHKIHHYRGTQSYYSACVCHWGYATDNSGNACTVAVSCDAEGGRCVRSCSPIRVGQAAVEPPPATPVQQPTPAQQSTPSSAEIARRCDALTAKAFPPREPGNPAAGTTNATGLEVQTYFKKCVANGGRMDNSTDGH